MMESEVTGNCHASFGERDGETHTLKDMKVRSVPTLFSPLLANIALHGMEYRIKELFPDKQSRKNGTFYAPHLIRYADDFVILHEDLTIVQRCQQSITEWLSDMGLELKPSKTRLTHTLNIHEGNVGFDFLGFTVRQFRVGKYQSGKNNQGIPLGHKTLIKPSKEKLKYHVAIWTTTGLD